jgi:hypothetical protein
MRSSYTGVARNHASDRFILITAKYSGVCSKKCGYRIYIGEEIVYDKVMHKAAHHLCPDEQDAIDGAQGPAYRHENGHFTVNDPYLR